MRKHRAARRACTIGGFVAFNCFPITARWYYSGGSNITESWAQDNQTGCSELLEIRSDTRSMFWDATAIGNDRPSRLI